MAPGNGDSRRERGGTALLLLAAAAGISLGIGLFTFGYARGASYLTDDPQACANCHVMREQHEGWMKSSHRRAAVCNDCHTPAGFVPKYVTKARNGFFHSLAFTTGRFPDRIRINAHNHRVANDACLKCHAEVVAGIRSARDHSSEASCLGCHPSVGHQH
jgi:cytochrome c nitrite reductase small subunit